MEEIKFDDAFLNEFFKQKVGKEKVTFDDMKMFEGEIQINGNYSTISQHDLDLIMNIANKIRKDVIFKDVNFENVTIGNGENIYRLKFYNCNLEGVKVKELKLTCLTLYQCEFGEDFITNIGKIQKLVALQYTGKNRQRTNIFEIGNLSTLIELELENIYIAQEDAKKLSRAEKLGRLSILDCDWEEDAIIPKNEKKDLYYLHLRNIKDMSLFKNLFATTELEIEQSKTNQEDIENLDLLESFTELKKLKVYGVNKITKHLPQASRLNALEAINCGITDTTFLDIYPHLSYCNLDENNISTKSYEDIMQMKFSGCIVSIKGTPLEEMMKSRKIIVKDTKIREQLKRILRVKSPEAEEINENDLLTSGEVIQIDNFEGISKKTIEKLLDTIRAKYICIKSFKGLNKELLDALKANPKIKYFVSRDLLAAAFENEYGGVYANEDRCYHIDDIEKILNVLQDIKKSIPESATELEKFLMVYKAIGLRASYDERAIKDKKEKYVEGYEQITRSLKGVLIQGSAVCYGYSLALKMCLEYIGIDCKMIGGYEHEWNQVKIDGTWYNVDITFDEKNLKGQKYSELSNCLKSDATFSKNHDIKIALLGYLTRKALMDEPEDCKEDYPIEEIEKGLKNTTTRGMARKKFMENIKQKAQKRTVSQSNTSFDSEKQKKIQQEPR